MKRLLVTILSILYMASATGATVHIHYCMGKLIAASLIDKEEYGCNNCCATKKAGKGCCKDEHKTIKVNDHQQAKFVMDFSCQQPAVVSIPRSAFYLSTACAESIISTATAHAPPSLWRTCPIYIRVRNFRL